MTHNEKESKRYHEILCDILTEFAKTNKDTQRYCIFKPVNEYNGGIIFDKTLKSIVTVSYGELGVSLIYCTKPNKMCGYGYHIGGASLTVKPNTPHYEFIGELSKEILNDAILYGKNCFITDIMKNASKNLIIIDEEMTSRYLYKNVDEYFKYRNKKYSDYEEL